MRPILSMVNSAQHKLAKFLNVLLNPVLEFFSSYTLKDSFTFVEQIKGMNSDNTFMASYDVKSLFTNVPLDEVINICADTLYKLDKSSISKKNFIKLLKFSTSGVHFIFNSQVYSQHNGIAMGSPLGPTLSNIFMGFIEKKVISKYKVTYFRYVDDCFVLGEDEKDIDELFCVLNKAHSSIKFTLEKENNNELPFLDVLVKRHNHKFLTTVFRKETFTGSYLNFHSFCSMKRKTNLIRTLCHRAYKICSKELFNDELNQIKLILNKNGYPQELVNKTINLHLKSLNK